MTDGAFNPADLLSGLAANPELLKNAMQMASALASSGALNGLFGGGATTEQPPKTSAAANAATPPSASFADLLAGLTNGSAPSGAPRSDTAAANAATPPSASFADLLAGLTNGSAPSGAPRSDTAAANASPVPTSVSAERERKGRPAPCHRDRVQLLQSICPFLPEEKREKVQFLIKLLGLLDAAESMGIGRLF